LLGLTDSLARTKQGDCDNCISISVTSVLMKSLQPSIGKSRLVRFPKTAKLFAISTPEDSEPTVTVGSS
jgi:hypothetical protein